MSKVQVPGGFVFPAPMGGPLRVINFRRRQWRRALDAAGLEGLRIHDLRHTAVALWIVAGAGPKEVAVRAGHTSVSFMLDRYGRLYPEADIALRDRLDRLIEELHGPQTAPGPIWAGSVRNAKAPQGSDLRRLVVEVGVSSSRT
jgi:integrase